MRDWQQVCTVCRRVAGVGLFRRVQFCNPRWVWARTRVVGCVVRCLVDAGGVDGVSRRWADGVDVRKTPKKWAIDELVDVCV